MTHKHIGKKLYIVVFIVICSLFFDVWLYRAVVEPVPAKSVAAGPSIQSDKIIYLTFDMDMDDAMYLKYQEKKTDWYDPALFSYLEDNRIPATFFASGLFMQAYPILIKDLASDGDFAFQNHSYDESSFTPHCYWLVTLTTNAEKTSQIEMTENIIRQMTGQTASYFRYPGVCHSAPDDALVRQLGFQIDDGTVISGDPFNTDVKKIIYTVLSEAKNRAVVLMHVGGPNAPESLAALEQIIPRLEREGYNFGKL